MPEFTPNSNLYKWNKTDTKQTTITEMANNADKIDSAFANVDSRLDAQEAEVDEARGTKADLNERFNDLDAQLAEKGAHVTTFSGVDKTGVTDSKTGLQTAVSNGGIIYFPKGTYLISQALETAADNTIFYFAKGAKLKTVGNNTGAIILKHNNCEVLYGTFEGTGLPATDIYSGSGVKLLGVEGCVVKDNTFINTSGIPIYLSPVNGVGCKNNKIENNSIKTPAGTVAGTSGILLGYSGTGYLHQFNTIENNYVDGNGILDYGIAIIGHGTDNQILNNTVRNCKSYGIVAYESQYEDYSLMRTSIIGNLVDSIGVTTGTTNMGMGIYLQKSHDSIVANNIVKNAVMGTDNTETLGRGGIALNSALRCIVESNQVLDSNHHGICVLYSFEAKIINNTVKSSAKYGIMLKNSNDNAVLGNILKSIGKGGIYGTFIVTDTSGVADYASLVTGIDLNISDNIIENLQNDGIALIGAAADILENVAISRNRINSSTGFIYTSYIKNSIISENICVSSGAVGTIQVAQSVSDRVKIINNILLTATNLTLAISYGGTNPDIRGNYIKSASTYVSFQSQNFRNEPITAFATAVPSSGTWTIGDTVMNLSLSVLGTTGSKYIVLGWKRITTGSGNVLNTDWVEMRVLTGQ